MPARHRANERAQVTIFRVFRIPEPLRNGIKTRQTKFNATTAQVIQNAIDEGLPKIVSELKGLGFGFAGTKKRPARFPMSESNLSALKLAAKQTGTKPTVYTVGPVAMMQTHRETRHTTRW